MLEKLFTAIFLATLLSKQFLKIEEIGKIKYMRIRQIRSLSSKISSLSQGKTNSHIPILMLD